MGEWFLPANWKCPSFEKSYIFDLMWPTVRYFKSSEFLGCRILKFKTEMEILYTCIRITRQKSKEAIWYGLEILVIWTLNEHEKAIEWIKSKTKKTWNWNKLWKIVVQNKTRIKNKIFVSCFPCSLIRETNRSKFFNSGVKNVWANESVR